MLTQVLSLEAMLVLASAKEVDHWNVPDVYFILNMGAPLPVTAERLARFEKTGRV
jgi:hypothetical protein